MNHDRLSNLLQSGPWAMDLLYGFKLLSQYEHDLELVKEGIIDPKTIADRYRTDASYPTYTDYKGNRIEGEQGIAHIYYSGPIMEGDGFCYRGVRSMIEDLEAIDSNPRVQGVLLELNSGGGSATASWMLHNALQAMSKPVVTLGHLVASGAYLAAVATHEIVSAGIGAEFGSIGALISLRNKDIADMKDNYTDIYSNLSGKKNHQIRSLLAGDDGPLREKLDQLAGNFITAVKAGRPNISNKEVFEGDMYPGKLAKKYGLIDQIGTKKTAISILNRHIKSFNK